MMKKIIIALTISLIGLSASAQWTYPIGTPTWYKKIRVDSVFWLNTVDTVHVYATLYPGALMTRTTGGDTSLYLANGHRWVRIGSASAGGGTIDSAWRSNDTLYFRYAASGALGVKMDYYSKSESDSRFIQNQNASAQTANFYITGNGTINNTLRVATTNTAAAPLQVGTLPSYANLSAIFEGNVQALPAASNNHAVTLQQMKDSVYKRMPGKIISTVTQLANYGPTDSLIFVTDVYRGGFFQWQAIGTADNGVLFAGTSGMWKRVFNMANGVNVRWYGPAADGTTNDVTKIQAAIDRAAADSVTTVYMNNMALDIGSTITVPSNITLNAYGSYIELIPGSSSDMIRNTDLINGNKNIKVLGGTWNGRGWTQTRTIAGTVSGSSFCFGMFFYRCENVEVGNMEIDSTRSWGIAAMEANRIYVHDIKMQQNPYKPDGSVGLAENGDGFTFGASNVLVERIYGFTNDDMVAAGAGGAIFAGVQAPFQQLSYENIVIKDIFPNAINDSIPTWRAVGIYAINGKRLTNVSVNNINGVTTSGKVIIANPLGDLFGGGLAFFENIILNNINGKSRAVAGFNATQFGIISVAASDVNKLIVEGCNRSDSLNTSQIKTTDSTIIRELNVSNVNIQSVGQLIRLIDDGGKIRSINISNVNIYDSLGAAGQRLYDRASSPFNTDTVFIKAANTHVTRPAGFSTISIGSGKVSFSSQSVIVPDTANFSPVEGNILVTENLGLVNYKSGRWIGTGVGYFNTYSSSDMVLSTNNTERGRITSGGVWRIGANTGERISARFNGISFNRDIASGSIFSSSGHAYQIAHTSSTTNTSDLLSLSVYNTAGTAVTSSALTINGAGNIGVGKNSQTSTLDISGSIAQSSTTITGNTTLDATQAVVLVNNTGTATITLPAAAGCSGRIYTIKKTSAASNDVVIDGNASETIDAATTKTLTLQYSSVTIQSNGTNWFILSSHAAATVL